MKGCTFKRKVKANRREWVQTEGPDQCIRIFDNIHKTQATHTHTSSSFPMHNDKSSFPCSRAVTTALEGYFPISVSSCLLPKTAARPRKGVQLQLLLAASATSSRCYHRKCCSSPPAVALPFLSLPALSFPPQQDFDVLPNGVQLQRTKSRAFHAVLF